jgi:hypothetical protein
MWTEQPDCAPTVEVMLRHLRAIVLDGVRHGFFDYSVTGEILNGGKRGITIKAGKSHRYIFPEDDLKQ